MLKMKYFEEFKSDRQLVILGNAQEYLRAGTMLANKETAILNDPDFAIYYDTKLLTQWQLYINKKECEELSEIFLRCGSNPGQYHYYYETEALEREFRIRAIYKD